MTFSSSRMLPGQVYTCMASMSADDRVGSRRLYRFAYLPTKNSTSCGISSGALAQRRHDDLDHLEPVIQILAELRRA